MAQIKTKVNPRKISTYSIKKQTCGQANHGNSRKIHPPAYKIPSIIGPSLEMILLILLTLYKYYWNLIN